jgi:modulator of FtsH protease HflK
MAEPTQIPPGQSGAPQQTRGDAGSRALAEALRSSFVIVRFVMILLVLVFIGSGFFKVNPQERVIVLRFGKPVGEGEGALLGPGRLHWSFPYPIDQRVAVSITGIQQVKSTVGWYFTTPAMEAASQKPPVPPKLNPEFDGSLLTADNNIIHSRATLSYHINDPVRYVFDFADAAGTLQNILDNALVRSAAQFSVDDVLTRNRLGFREAVRSWVDEEIQKRGLGVVLDQCDVESIQPRQADEAFRKVNEAEVARSTALNEARSDEIKILSQAGADASSLTNRARSDATALVAEASGLAAQFEGLLPIYRQDPGLLKRRVVETLGRVMTNADYKIFLSESPGGNQELRLMLNREIPKRPQ